MENTGLTLGPRPALPRGSGLSRARATVLQAVVGSSAPASLAQLTESTGLHANTLREHLDALLADGLVTREPAAPHGRGRPAWLYRAAAVGAGVQEYAGLATALAAAIHRASTTPVDDAVQAGTEWGHELAATAAGRATAAPAPAQVLALLDDMGFGTDPVHPAEDTPSSVRLTRCPLLDAARRYPDVVCGVHLGIVRGALEEYGGDGSGVRLHPFAEPGACLLHLSATAEPDPASVDQPSTEAVR